MSAPLTPCDAGLRFHSHAQNVVRRIEGVDPSDRLLVLLCLTQMNRGGQHAAASLSGGHQP